MSYVQGIPIAPSYCQVFYGLVYVDKDETCNNNETRFRYVKR